jgi:glutamine amidotransferase
MGWNDLQITQPEHQACTGLTNDDHAYFVHSFHAKCANASDVLATVDYGETVTALIGRNNMLGAQFHPEKSQKVGEKLIRNFLDL